MALNFADLFEHAADAVGGRVAVACCDRQVTYAELEERTSRLAHHLAGLGVGPGALQEHVRRQLVGYKVPRTIWLADAIRRTVSGKADYGWAREYAASHAPGVDRVSGAHSATAPR